MGEEWEQNKIEHSGQVTNFPALENGHISLPKPSITFKDCVNPGDREDERLADTNKQTVSH